MVGAIKAQTGSAASPSYVFAADLTTGFYSAGAGVIGVASGGIASGQITASGFSNVGGIPTGVPVGTVVGYAGASAPTGWLLCFGQSVATATYPALFTAIAYTYGGSGPNFSIPDCRGRATFGKDNMGGSAANRITVAGGNFDGTALGGTGGQQNFVVAQTYLPNVNFTVTIPNNGANQTALTHNHTYISPLAAGGSLSYNAGGTGASTNTGSSTALVSALAGTAASGGSGTALPVLSNAIIFNMIIFAGA